MFPFGGKKAKIQLCRIGEKIPQYEENTTPGYSSMGRIREATEARNYGKASKNTIGCYA